MPSTKSQIASAFRFTLFALSFAARCTASAVLFPVRPLLAARQEEAEREANDEAVEERLYWIKQRRAVLKRRLDEKNRELRELRSRLEKLNQQHRDEIAEVERHFEEVERQREAERQRVEKIAAEKARRAALTPGQRMAENCHKFWYLSHALSGTYMRILHTVGDSYTIKCLNKPYPTRTREETAYIDQYTYKLFITLEYIANLYNTSESALIKYFENSENFEGECGCEYNYKSKCYFARSVESYLRYIYNRKSLPTINYTDKSVHLSCDCQMLHDFGCSGCLNGEYFYDYSWIPGRESEKPDPSHRSILPDL